MWESYFFWHSTPLRHNLLSSILSLKVKKKEHCRAEWCLCDCFHFWFWPPKFNFFSNIVAYKKQNFQVIQQTEIYVIEIHTNNMDTKFQNIFFVFGSAMAKKHGKVMISHFWNAILLAFLFVVHKNKCHFWNPETQLHIIGIFWKNLKFGIWPNLTYFDMNLTFHRVRFENECHYQILRLNDP